LAPPSPRPPSLRALRQLPHVPRLLVAFFLSFAYRLCFGAPNRVRSTLGSPHAARSQHGGGASYGRPPEAKLFRWVGGDNMPAPCDVESPSHQVVSAPPSVVFPWGPSPAWIPRVSAGCAFFFFIFPFRSYSSFVWVLEQRSFTLPQVSLLLAEERVRILGGKNLEWFCSYPRSHDSDPPT